MSKIFPKINIKVMFGNCFFFLIFLFSKTIFCFLRQKTCLVIVFRQKLKTIFNFHIVKEIENRSRAVFIFQFSLTLENTEKTL